MVWGDIPELHMEIGYKIDRKIVEAYRIWMTPEAANDADERIRLIYKDGYKWIQEQRNVYGVLPVDAPTRTARRRLVQSGVLPFVLFTGIYCEPSMRNDNFSRFPSLVSTNIFKHFANIIFYGSGRVQPNNRYPTVFCCLRRACETLPPIEFPLFG